MSLVLGFKSLVLALDCQSLALASEYQSLALTLEVVVDIGLEHSNFLANTQHPLPFSQVSRSTYISFLSSPVQLALVDSVFSHSGLFMHRHCATVGDMML